MEYYVWKKNYKITLLITTAIMLTGCTKDASGEKTSLSQIGIEDKDDNKSVVSDVADGESKENESEIVGDVVDEETTIEAGIVDVDMWNSSDVVAREGQLDSVLL